MSTEKINMQKCVCGETHPEESFSETVWTDESACPSCQKENERLKSVVKEAYGDLTVSEFFDELKNDVFLQDVKINDESMPAWYVLNLLEQKVHDILSQALSD